MISLNKLYIVAIAVFWGAAQIPVSPADHISAPIGLVPVSSEQALLFASVFQCRNEGSEPAAGILASFDGGKSWRAVQEPIPRATFEFASDPKKGSVWIVGYEYVEGPDSDPFVLVPRSGNELGWDAHYIYQGAAELDAVSLTDAQHLFAWVRHLKLTEKGWAGPEYMHISTDGGRTWKQIGLAERFNGATKGTGFAKIRRQADTWRLRDIEQKPGGFVVDRTSDGGHTWGTVATFPVHRCGTP